MSKSILLKPSQSDALLSNLLTLLMIATLLLFPARSRAQTDQGAITGVAQDTSGAIIPNAQISAVNADTGLVLQGKSNATGRFVFSPLKIGNYTITATAPGFEKVTHENLHLDIQQHLNLTFVLPPGSVTQTVTVTTGAPLLQTQDAAVGQVISTRSINDTPLNGRTGGYIPQLTAGVLRRSATRVDRARATSWPMASAPNRITSSLT